MYPNLKKKDKKKKEGQKEGNRQRTERLSGEIEKKEKKKFFASFQDLWKSSSGFSSEQKLKSVHVSKATHEYQNPGVLSNSTR